LVESAVLALAGGVLGLLLANAGTGLLLRVSSGSVPLPRLNDVHVDRLVLPFATAISLGSSLASFPPGKPLASISRAL